MNWYINKKTNKLVQAIWEEDVNGKDYGCWFVYKDGRKIGYLKDADFQSQYGEAMVNNPMIPADDKPHIKDKFCDNLGCIPYIPEQKQADEEPVFPICGTCNAQKDSKPDSSLLLPEMKAVEKAIELQKYSEDEGYVLMPADYYRAGMVAELDHLAKLGIVYAKVEIECPQCKGEGYECWLDEGGNHQGKTCVYCKSVKKIVKYISLSDYMKREGK